MIVKGRFNRKFYYCANYYGDFQNLYDREYIEQDERGIVFLPGDTVFNFPFWDQNTIDEVRNLFNKSMDIELHGIAPNKVNLGVYTDNPIDLEYCYMATNCGYCEYKVKKNA